MARGGRISGFLSPISQRGVYLWSSVRLSHYPDCHAFAFRGRREEKGQKEKGFFLL